MAGRKGRFPWHVVVFLAPATLIYTVFMIYPLLDSLRLSLFTRDEAGAEHFAGLANYAALFFDPQWADRFWNALGNNVLFFAVHMLVQNPIAIGLAALLSLPNLRFTNTYRTLMFTPTLLSVVIIGFIWKLILSPTWGVAKSMLGTVGLGSLFAPWLGQEGSALFTLALVSVWQWVGMPLLLTYAALLNIPESLTEAARVDGASQMKIFWRIKLPLIWPTIGMVTILTFVGNFNAFDLIYVSQGALAGPNFATDILGTFFYRTFFGFQLQLGDPTMGAAVATIMFLIILAGVMTYFYLVQRRLQRYEL
ncbi:ABC transporter permease [Inquilinus limosus MP06]|uniref:ABC transporter permease n=1 Tax=Inquilinus limosus MP06 TaxID=1398085 RepID=A0A0A0D902_9PROT|nr:ABC transporter permease [Inquilinus limosus MP06]